MEADLSLDPLTSGGVGIVPHKSVSREYLEALLIAVIFATFARTFVVQAFKIPTGSMEKNLLVGDHILVNKFVYGSTWTLLERLLQPSRPVRRGDVVVFKFPQDPYRDFIKRCVALPGDEVETRDRQLYVNGKPIDESGYAHYLNGEADSFGRVREPGGQRDHFGPYTVPPDHYFCLGDNRDNSNDSRFWGAVPAHYIKGRAFMIYWSYDGGEPHVPAGLWGRVRQVFRVLAGFFTHTRWQRCFRIVQ